MSPMEWALACGTLLAADVRGKPSKNLQDLTLQLQIHRWPLCRSLCINLEQLHKGVSVTPNQTMKISQAGSTLPRLQCLHMIGRDQVPLTESSVEGMLLGILARHVLVLSLHVKVSPVPLDLPALQHLVLDLDTNSAKKDVWQTQAALVPAISTLKGLRTLYVRCVKTEITSPTDMTGCKHLQHVTLQGVRFKGTLALPRGCHLHAKCEPLYDCELSPTIADVVTGLTFRPGSSKKRILRLFWGPLRLLPSHIKTQNLKQLRLTLGKLDMYEMYWKKEEVPFRTRDELPFGQKLPVPFYASDMPGLEVLEVDVEGNLSIYIDPKLPLRTIVLIAAGTLKIDNMQLAFEMCLAPMATLKQLYFQWGTASESMPKYDAAAEPFKEADLGGTWRRVHRELCHATCS